jgi:hypothetical protein
VFVLSLQVEVSVDAQPHRLTDQADATVEQDEAKRATAKPRLRFAFAHECIPGNAES